MLDRTWVVVARGLVVNGWPDGRTAGKTWGYFLSERGYSLCEGELVFTLQVGAKNTPPPHTHTYIIDMVLTF